MFISFPFLTYYRDDGHPLKAERDPTKCLLEHETYKKHKGNPDSQLVVSSSFYRPKVGEPKVGRFRMHEDRQSFFERILLFPDERHYNTVLLPGEPVYWYADVDLEIGSQADTLTLANMEARLAALVKLVKETFQQTYDADMHLNDETVWYFSASNREKWSFHLHVDPDRPNVIFEDSKALQWFMRKVDDRLQELDRSTSLLWYYKQSKQQWEPIIDFSVYNARQNIKLPLNSKPGKTVMTLHRAPAGVVDTSDFKQLEVGMILVPREKAVDQIMYEGQTGPATTQRRSRTTVQPGIVASNHNVSQMYECIHRLVRPVLGERATVYNWGSGDGTFQGGTAECPFQHRIHSSNRIRVRGSRATGKLVLSCFDSVSCKGKYMDVHITRSDDLDILFPEPAVASDDDIEEKQPEDERHLSRPEYSFSRAATMASSVMMECDGEQPADGSEQHVNVASCAQAVAADDPQFDDQLGPGLVPLDRYVPFSNLPNGKLGDAVLNELKQHTHVATIAGKGTGKTTTIRKLIHDACEQQPTVRILVFSCRRSFATNLLKELNDALPDSMHFRSYIDSRH